jgi:hypothetical protein
MDGVGILLPFGLFYGRLVHFIFIWYIFPVFGLYQGKSCNPGGVVLSVVKLYFERQLMATSQSGGWDKEAVVRLFRLKTKSSGRILV